MTKVQLNIGEGLVILGGAQDLAGWKEAVPRIWKQVRGESWPVSIIALLHGLQVNHFMSVEGGMVTALERDLRSCVSATAPCVDKSLGLSRQEIGMMMLLPYLQSVLRKSPMYS